MPNWCDNYLGVAGEMSQVRQFIEAARGEGQPLCFQRLYPASTDDRRANTDLVDGVAGTADCDAGAGRSKLPGVNPEWYVDRVNKWGVKWDALFGGSAADGPVVTTAANNEVDEDVDGDEIVVAVYHFGTAWGPPERLFDKVCIDNPSLSFRLRWVVLNEGCWGVSEWAAGTRVYSKAYEWEALDCIDWPCEVQTL